MDVAQVYPFRMKGILRLDLLECVVVLAKSLRFVAEGMDEDEVPKVMVAIQSKDWILAGTEVGLPLIDDVTKFQAPGDYGLALSSAGSEPVIVQRMTLEEKAEIVVTPHQGGRRHLPFRDAVALLRETELKEWPHLGSRGTKEFLTSIRDGSGKLEKPPHELGAP